MVGQVIALLGAESTGKTTLAQELARVLTARGLDAVMVPEALRLFCDVHGRTPLVHEQAGIAVQQAELIEQARQSHQWVIADTTPLMIAVYSDHVFGDRGLYEQASHAHARLVDATLLMSLDLAWTADGLQRDGPHVREPVDTLLRAALQSMGLAYGVVAGQGSARFEHALSVIDHLLGAPLRRSNAEGAPRWRWFCDNCDDGECEQHWLPRER